nr:MULTISPECIES: DUF350 domain-containing protein [unclassified Bradyrhizobium]
MNRYPFPADEWSLHDGGTIILLGFVAPLVSAIAHSANVLDCVIWATIALVVQVIVFFLVKVPVPNLSARISAGEFAPAIWLGSRAVWLSIREDESPITGNRSRFLPHAIL